MGINIGQVLRQTALRCADRIAVVDHGAGERAEVSYGELDRDARRVASGLREAGVQAGERVALCAENGRAFIACWFGAVYAGCTVVPIPILAASREIAFRLDHAGCRTLVTDAPRRDVGTEAIPQLQRHVVLHDAETMRASEPASSSPPADTAPDATAMILYTSGTLGAAKGTCITHASLMAHTSALVHHTLQLRSDERVLGAIPLTHSYGIRMGVLAPFYAGGRCVLVPRFEAERTRALLHAEAVSWLPAVPTMYAAWAALGDGTAPPALRWCLSAGAPLADDVRRRAEDALGAEIRQGYGLTEATFSTLDAPPDERGPSTVGRPVWGVEVRVIDEAGNPRPAGEEGEIVVRGQNVMKAYLDDPEGTAQVLRDGWMHTGDVGRIDTEGRLTVVDRIKDLIIRGGNNVYPSEVEDALAEHPAVKEVAVVGRPDAHYGEEVVAVVVLHDGCSLDLETAAAWCRERIARYKVPRDLVVVDAMPVGPSGKVLKRELRARIASS